MKITDFDYLLPPELIAQDPVDVRDQSRLLVLPLTGGAIKHGLFTDIIDYLSPQDVLVINNTRVIPARLWGTKAGVQKKIEVLLLTRLSDHSWEAMVRPGRRVPVGTVLDFGPNLSGVVTHLRSQGLRQIDFRYQGDWESLLASLGEMPLPPYIKKQPRDVGRYQTIYAQHPGSVAAPTAGLHFSPQLLQNIKSAGVAVVPVLLHVGLGTFRPVQVEDITQHIMHTEYYEIPATTAQVINARKAHGGRVIAVGTTTVRCLETATQVDGRIEAGTGYTDIFIYPGYNFKAVDGLITNFHLPRSTLLMMVSALVGRERLLQAYQQAIVNRYRFYSFGDAMLII